MLRTLNTLTIALGVALPMAAPATAWSNPCSVDLFAGRNVVSSGPQPKIEIAREDLTLTLDHARFEGYTGVASVAVEVDYVFQNTGDPSEVVMGFPIGASVDGIPVVDFAVSGTGVGPLVSVHAADRASIVETSHLSPCERGVAQVPGHDELIDLPGEFKIGWFLWRQRFEPGQTSLRVTYKHVPVKGGLCQFHYFLETAKYWGSGAIGRLRVTVEETGLRPSSSLEVEMFGRPPIRKKRQQMWTLENFAPTDNILLRMSGCG